MNQTTTSLFNINSRTILPIACVYIAVCTIVIAILFQKTQNLLKEAGLQEQLDLAFRDIETGAPLHNVLNNNSFHANYYLVRQMNSLDIMAPGRYLEAEIIAEEGGTITKRGRYVDTYAKWTASKPVASSACPTTYDRFYSSADGPSLFDFRVLITVDDCHPTDLGSREMKLLSLGLAVICLLLLLPFKLLSGIFASLRRVEDFMGSRDPEVLDAVAKQIRFEEIRTLFLRATRIQGESIFHYRSLMQDVKHNIMRILLRLEDASHRLDVATTKLGTELDPELSESLRIVGAEFRRELAQLKSANSHLKVKHVRGPAADYLTSQDFCQKVENLLNVGRLEFSVPDCNIRINFEILEPALLNINSNLRSYGRNGHGYVSMNNSRITIAITNDISLLRAVLLSLANLTNRIDTETADKQVYKKIIGHEGLGLNMIKRACLDLEGKMIFHWTWRSATIGLDFPVKISEKVVEVKDALDENRPVNVATRQAIIVFRDPANVREAERLGLAKMIESNDNMLQLVKKQQVREVITDYDLTLDPDADCKVRRIRNIKILEGIAQNLQAAGTDFPPVGNPLCN